ncbi:transcriptional regulator, ArsR family [Renibacterium salmoninarum ATCC 33209]|uniref:Transcriptional regulator, ArsR family n=1 Tax=Renibacterium salmoninarum (strain ATCC 33209 / DSM 20767 / JCM 11484 / NBRC 15589 / NCIMB 2235) TaxID=288705 RepID=A9WTC7_RENSM|nr:metalloregulator ArsR/SmtB family transcription factor [Renibacterium salmoninarum]ABY24448.1 transcriptional regulator, ArsR family [Renibacterium salmoninarum ATCC 33209]
MVNEDVFTVLAERTRREILTALQKSDKAVGELVEELGASQPTVSKHLRVLREAGLVSMRAEGQRRFYKLVPAPLATVADWLEDFGVATPGWSLTASEAQGVNAGLTGARHPASASTAPANFESPEVEDPESMPQQIGRSVGRAATKAADLIANLPKFGRRKETQN